MLRLEPKKKNLIMECWFDFGTLHIDRKILIGQETNSLPFLVSKPLGYVQIRPPRSCWAFLGFGFLVENFSVQFLPSYVLVAEDARSDGLNLIHEHSEIIVLKLEYTTLKSSLLKIWHFFFL